MREALKFQNTVKRDAMQADAHIQAGMQSGLITSFDPVTQSAKVMLKPYDVETGYLPVRTHWAGNGWGLFSPPTVGEMVDVHFTEGDLDSGAIMGRAHNDVDKPLPVPSGELWAVHSSGLRLVLANNGTALLGGTVTGAGIIMLGNTADLHTLVKDTFMALYNSHTHSDPQGGSVGPPNQQMTADAHLTKETKAS